MERFAKLAAEALNSVLEQPIQVTDLEIPPNPEMGDFAFPCFKLAKQFRKGPPQVAAEILKQLQEKKVVPLGLAATANGPYVNFTAAPELVMSSLLKDILGPNNVTIQKMEYAGNYGAVPAGSRGTWVLEYSSPNVAKPLNIYHLRTTALGGALDRIGRYRGYQVISINHLGDWGKQYGMLAVAFKRFGITEETQLTMRDLVDLYVKINAEAERDSTIEEEARQAFLSLEKGDPAITRIWKKCVDISLLEFAKNYGRIRVEFDHIWGESYYKDQLAPLLDDLRKKNLLVQSEGAWVVPVTDEDGKEMPPCILQKSDGATIYATRDLAAAIYRYEKFKFDRMTYIVGGEQKLHFKQVFAVLKKLGVKWADRCEHVPTGLYRFKDAKMSTRKGNFVTLEEVLDLAKERVATLMKERNHSQQQPETPARESLEDVSEMIAVGAVVYHDLHTDPARDVDFDIERVVDFEGETGPYLQYAHTRCLSILRKAATQSYGAEAIQFNADRISALTTPEELRLVKILGQLPLHLERSLQFSKASQLSTYLIDVTRAFGAFYRECQVLGPDRELTQGRLMLVEATRRILSNGLTLLGIPLPTWM